MMTVGRHVLSVLALALCCVSLCVSAALLDAEEAARQFEKAQAYADKLRSAAEDANKEAKRARDAVSHSLSLMSRTSATDRAARGYGGEDGFSRRGRSDTEILPWHIKAQTASGAMGSDVQRQLDGERLGVEILQRAAAAATAKADVLMDAALFARTAVVAAERRLYNARRRGTEAAVESYAGVLTEALPVDDVSARQVAGRGAKEGLRFEAWRETRMQNLASRAYENWVNARDADQLARVEAEHAKLRVTVAAHRVEQTGVAARRNSGDSEVATMRKDTFSTAREEEEEARKQLKAAEDDVEEKRQAFEAANAEADKMFKAAIELDNTRREEAAAMTAQYRSPRRR
ncbi:hypothetical protein DQ04_18851000 [Trypanosoma grayi]|uniref:hypothetical protein n=1 Tax=Trypanosoma grayi TaxID=71804 RepID=UPI0004F3FC71|nr:hypothetical protein DQ04_18851000 [Trypanosoma grayi]KEG05737.1 hypothetical protein DQ04_18851000 [Trypanosoma grayi]